MCGITGILSSRPDEGHQQAAQSAAGILSHRGPQHHGLWCNTTQTIALAHQRLSIIDLSDCAAQPLHYLDRYVIVHNGELYNYLELKKTLEGKGFRFTSASDTEVIVAAYAAYGAACLQQLDGMFAFAIWDEKEKKLFAARDRFGEKPFFFFYDGAQFLFASEMKALWKMGVEKAVNQALLYNFLTIGYTGNPADPQETFYRNIRKLPAASFLVYSTETSELAIENYWRLPAEENTSITEEQALVQFQHLLSGSVRQRLRSDVPVGTSLSGGLDSATLVAFCAREAAPAYTHQCFTAVFPGFEKNEEAYAAQVAREFDLQHHLVEISGNDLPRQMETLMYHQEEPVGSASALAQFQVYRAAKQAGVTVLIDGQGADEVLAGYHKYYHWYWQQLYRQKRLAKSGELAAARQNGVQEAFTLRNKTAALLPDLAAALLQSGKARTARRHPHLQPDFAFTHKRDLYYSLPTTPDLTGALYFNTVTYGLEELLRIADRNSMAHAVEVRLPFLQHGLVEFLFSLPPHLKIRQGWTKWLLRKSMEQALPAGIVWRKDKVGFEPPQQSWMKREDVKESIMEGKKTLVRQHILSPAALRSYRPAPAHAAGNFDWRYWSASFLFGH